MPGREAVRKRQSPTLPWGQSPGRSMTADGWPPLVPRRAPEGARHTPYLLTLLSFTCARPRPRATLNFSESGGTSGSHSVRLCHHGLTLGLCMPTLGWVSLRHHWHLWPDRPLLLGGHPVHWVMFNSTPPRPPPTRCQ